MTPASNSIAVTGRKSHSYGFYESVCADAQNYAQHAQNPRHSVGDFFL